MAKIKFTKLQGLGNDFVLIDASNQKIKPLPRLVKKICARRIGIGADQLLLLLPSPETDFRMRVFNADGGEVEMCGNGIRCLAKYLYTHKLISQKRFSVATRAGIIRLEIEGKGKTIKVDLGEPLFAGEKIPLRRRGRIISSPLEVGGRRFKITCLSLGNPHCVVFGKDLDKFKVSRFGPLLEKHSFFPQRTNVEFVQLLNKKEIRMRVWERGTGETPACGTGACAAAVASVLNKKTERKVTVHLPGGDLKINWAENNHVYMSGPAQEVFQGEIEIKL